MNDISYGELIQFAFYVVLLVTLLTFAKRLHALTTVLATNTSRLEATVDRMEEATKVVASDLAATLDGLVEAAEQRLVQGEAIDRMEAATHVVADNLADSVSRADATEGPDGAAADAALRTGDTAHAIQVRQDERRMQEEGQ
jgi:hypothetical protein